MWFTAFSAADIRAMELTILSALDWWSMCATPVDFLDCLMCLANIGRNDEGVLADGGRPATTIRHIAQELIIQTLKGAHSQAKTPPLSSRVPCAFDFRSAVLKLPRLHFNNRLAFAARTPCPRRRRSGPRA